MGIESYSVSEAARKLGVSIPTLKRMAADGEFENFRTPGGHLRVPARSIESLHLGVRPPSPHPRQSSTVLANRRERVEELGLEAQELRAKREIAKLNAEEEAEYQRRQEETASRERAAEREFRAEERELERWKQHQAEERQRREQDKHIAEFHSRWLKTASEVLSDSKFSWLAGTRRREVLKAVEAEIKEREPGEEACMKGIISQAITDVAGPWYVDWQRQEKLQEAMQTALRNLPYGATDIERARASAAVRKALESTFRNAEEFELRAVAGEAMRPVRQAIEKRNLTEKLIRWAIWELPSGQTDSDERRLRRECAEILSKLPDNILEEDAKEALQETIQQTSEEIEVRKATQDQSRKKAALIQQGLFEVSPYLLELRHAEAISSEEYLDSELKADLTEALKQTLEDEICGDESWKEVKELVRGTIDDELDLG